MTVSTVDGNDSRQEDVPSPRLIANDEIFILIFQPSSEKKDQVVGN